MPFDINSVDKHHKGLGKKQKGKWVKIANNRLKTCIAEGGTDKSCAGSAIKVANSIFEKGGKRKT